MRKLPALFLAFLIYSQPLFAAVAYVTSGSVLGTSGTGTTLSFACASGNYATIESMIRASASNPTVTDASYNGSAAGFIRLDNINSVQRTGTEIWGLSSPTCDGNSHTAAINYSGNIDNNLSMAIHVFSGVDLSSPISGHNGATGNGTAVSVTVTTTKANAMVHDAVYHPGDSGLTVDASQVATVDAVTGPSTDAQGCSYELGGAAGGVVMSWTDPESASWSQSAVALNADTGGTVVPFSPTTIRNAILRSGIIR